MGHTPQLPQEHALRGTSAQRKISHHTTGHEAQIGGRKILCPQPPVATASKQSLVNDEAVLYALVFGLDIFCGDLCLANICGGRNYMSSVTVAWHT